MTSFHERWSLEAAVGFGVAGIGALASALGLVLIKSSHAIGAVARRRRRWLLGTLVLCTVNPVCDVIALWLAPLSLLSPLGALSVIASLVFARLLLHEHATHRQWALASVATLGVTLASVAGPHGDAMPSEAVLDQRLGYASLGALWVVAIHALTLLALLLNRPRTKHRLHGAGWLGLLTAVAAGAIGSVGALFIKIALRGVAPFLRGQRSLALTLTSHWSTQLALVLLAPAAIAQLVLLNASLSQSAIAVSAPVYQVTFSLCVLLNGALLLNETGALSPTRLVAFGAGVAIATVCSFALGLLRAEAPSQPRASPLSASDKTESRSTHEVDEEL